MSEPLVVAEELEREYRMGPEPVRVLRGVSLTVNAGECVAIIGASGVGKSTLLHLLGTLDRPTSGRVLFDGEDVSTRTDAALARLRRTEVGFIFQFYNLLPVLSAVENVEMPLLVSGVPSKEARDRAMKALELVHLTNWANHKPGALSGGQRQRVTIARALVNEPAIVWADEPTGDLDSKNADEIMELIVGLNERNQQTFVIVTHDLRIAQSTNRIVNMLDGQIAEEMLTERGRTGASPARTLQAPSQ